MVKILIPMILMSLTLISGVSFAQKGTGQRTGIAREGINPEIISFTGIIKDMKDGPCVSGTGRYESGSHLILEIFNESTINVHIGPTQAVGQVMSELSFGQKITVLAFKTPELCANHYIAKEIFIESKHYVLRNDILRPFWAGKEMMQ